MNKNDVIAIVLWVLILTFITLILTRALITEKSERTYTYTTAFCDTANKCQDYEVRCEEGKIVSVVPVTGASIEFKENWIDPRDLEGSKVRC